MEINEMIHTDKDKLFVMEQGIMLAAAIREFTEQMAIKVADHIGEGDGWDEGGNAADMRDALLIALSEGDYVSVANYSMFLNGLGYKPGRSGG